MRLLPIARYCTFSVFHSWRHGDMENILELPLRGSKSVFHIAARLVERRWLELGFKTLRRSIFTRLLT